MPTIDDNLFLRVPENGTIRGISTDDIILDAEGPPILTIGRGRYVAADALAVFITDRSFMALRERLGTTPAPPRTPRLADGVKVTFRRVRPARRPGVAETEPIP